MESLAQTLHAIAERIASGAPAADVEEEEAATACTTCMGMGFLRRALDPVSCPDCAPANAANAATSRTNAAANRSNAMQTTTTGPIDGKVLMTSIAMLALAIDAARERADFDDKRSAVWSAIANADPSISAELADFAAAQAEGRYDS